ncbi:glycosyltransferase family 8 protein [Butyrivibrio fibrisolvens]|uniref:glycosyltransferase family 8 protein n=1 Tax=Pseudobutyrivibrio ruminis TaxID=46206 RepID=UPI00040DAD5A|nr:glycosyltransferase family 8 protein [Pseudobutyrivibrio ruminis]MDC7279111.1 glycosyltransferase family 8 protein [Butyrivibrio fibrisolvens]
MDVVYITDEYYIMPTTVSIVSLIENNKEAFGTIYVICEGCTAKELEKILNLKTYRWDIKIINVDSEKYIELEQELKDKTNTHVSRAALHKFSIPNLIKDVDKILYIDGDIIVNKSIKNLFDIDLEGYYMAAVEDMGNLMFCYKGEPSHSDRIEMKGEKYYNSGLMLLNLKEMRKDSVGEKLLDYRINKINYFMDQDAFNYCMHERILELSYKFNFRAPLFYEANFDEINTLFFESRYTSYDELLNDMVILHLSANYKPWEYYTQFFSDIFLKYYKKSPYKDISISLRSLEHQIWDNWYTLYKENGELLAVQSLYQNDIAHMDYKFPYEKIPKGSQLVIYGAGKVGKNFVEQLNKTNYCEVVLWVDSRYKELKDVSSPDSIRNAEYDAVLVAAISKDVIEDILTKLSMYDVQKECIVTIY